MGEAGPAAAAAAASPHLVGLLRALVQAERSLPRPAAGPDPGGADGAAGALAGGGWLRLLYLYPDEIDAPLLEALADSDGTILPYIDMPIQVRPAP